MKNENFISALVRNQFPSFYEEEGKNFLSFMEAYYNFLEQERGIISQTNTLLQNHNIDESLESFIEYFRKDIIPSIPDSIVANKRLLAKHIKDFYQSRGTLSAYKLLFRILFNEDVEINYPSDQILKVSDGNWRIDRYLVTVHRDQNYNLIGQTITGLESGAFALVEDVVRRVVRGRDVDLLLLSNINGFFINSEFVSADELDEEYVPVPVEAGIHSFNILSGGADYAIGDKFDIISEKKGLYGKIIVTGIEDKKGIINFTVRTGGSGYTSTTSDFSAKSLIRIEGADSVQPASFEIYESDLSDKFAITLCTTLFNSNTIFGTASPFVASANGQLVKMDQIKDIILGTSDLGIPLDNQEVSSYLDYREHSNAVIEIANTIYLGTGASIYGDDSGANGIIKLIREDDDGAGVFIIDGYKNFQIGEDVRVGYANGDVIGTASQFYGNTIGHHIVTIGNNAGVFIQEEDELIGAKSGAYGVVKKIITINTGGYNDDQGDVRDLLFLTVTSNTTSNTTSYFGTGPMKHFIPDEGLAKVTDPLTPIGNVATFSANTAHQNKFTPLRDLLNFISTTIGSIDSISEEVGGSGYRIRPTVSVVEPSIKALGIGEVYLTVQNTAPNWSTGNSEITTIDSNDRVRQSSSGASGDVKVRVSAKEVASSNTGTLELVVRIWQDQSQRFPSNINYVNGEPIQIEFYDSADQTNLVTVGSGIIVGLEDKGILGDNADIDVTLGANGSMTSLKVIDSGVSYEDGEVLEIQESDTFTSQRALIDVSLLGVANAEGYYATSRSHISSKSGFIQDSRFYQEFSYEVLAPLALERYRDIAKLLVHPSGQALFGRYLSHSEVDLTIETSVSNEKRVLSDANVSISNSSSDMHFTSNVFSLFSNGEYIIVETEPKVFRKALLNIVNANGTFANITTTWNEDSISDANVYYTTGSIL